ncbi:MAG TPA: 4-hydroxy-3-methylbut-2-enyl diphosphate reductase, partial [Dermatophilaceae bacterium]|nr:4-hydroxy-3-methylbut-2-enyl diphosphate reductase [Dermatophilaceae bacterium]
MPPAPDTSPTAPSGSPPKRVLLAAPRGYCAGVDRAVVTVEKALELYGPPVYVRKEIVH